ncbi:RNA polymerase sigma factor SigZ [Gorillibacterium sp. sgz5001074]|uniref:RNA polymerase sigma factor SigZ n=1 Tax=Gorillibacterium sp. sgz5001074 TaxID=3446695 RepID=UPI003F66FFB0
MEMETLWGAFHEPLKAFITRRVSNEQEAEDILQDVFLKIFTKMDSLRDEESLKPWIYQITRHSIIDNYRKRKPVGDQLLHDLPEFIESNESNLNMELSACLRPMIQQLPDKYREAIELTELEGLSQVELSQKLGISFSGAKSRVQRGRQKLKDIISACCHLELDRYGNVLEIESKDASPKCNSCGCQ